MKRKSNYVFGAALAGCALSGVPGLLQKVEGAVMTAADFTFDSNSAAASSSTTAISYLADIGTGTAYGVHAASSSFTFSTGNGSFNALSGNNWSTNDYFQFAVPTSGISNIVLSFDALASSTGPQLFELEYSTDGSNFSTFTSFSVIHSSSAVSYTGTYDGTNPASAGSTKTLTNWSSAFSISAFNDSFDLSGITGLNNDPNAIFELAAASAPASSAGTFRVDNFIVSGTTVPEPASLAIVSLAASATLLRRRRSS